MQRAVRTWRMVLPIVLVLLYSACQPIQRAPPTTPPTVAAQPTAVPLISRQLLFGNPDKITVKLSPDGANISYLAPSNGVLNVWVGPVTAPLTAQAVTHDTGRGISSYGWAYTNQHILYIQDQKGDENWRLYSVDLTTNTIQDLTPVADVQARIQQVSPQFPAEILVGLNEDNPQWHDLYRINIRTGERRLVYENRERFAGFVTDDTYAVRAAARYTTDGGLDFLVPTPTGQWQVYMQIPSEDTLTTAPLLFDQSGQILYMIDSRNRNTSALVALNMATGEQRLIAEHPQADVSDLLIHRTQKTIEAVAFTYERKQWQVVVPTIAAELSYLQSVADGELEVTARTLDDQRWIVAYLEDAGPVKYYLYDRATRQTQFLFSHQQGLEGLPLAPMQAVTIRSRDGLDLVSYLTLPLGSDADANQRPDRPLPLVLLVHGGPWERDTWGYNPLHQFLANRGYAVLSVNFRASTGFGKTFLNAGNREWGGKMHEDLLDAIQWAIAEKLADPAHIAIMGGSYGGYATLWAMTNNPTTFACGVDIVGPANLLTLLAAIPPYWQPQIELFATRVGDPRTAAGRAFLTERSPLTYVAQIEKPLLIGQGANDVRVKQSESDQIVKAMAAKRLAVTYVLYPDEGHGFARPENNLAFFAVTEAFLAQCLGGRYAPIGQDLQGSSITVPTGAQAIPGLVEALPK